MIVISDIKRVMKDKELMDLEDGGEYETILANDIEITLYEQGLQSTVKVLHQSGIKD